MTIIWLYLNSPITLCWNTTQHVPLEFTQRHPMGCWVHVRMLPWFEDVGPLCSVRWSRSSSSGQTAPFDVFVVWSYCGGSRLDRRRSGTSVSWIPPLFTTPTVGLESIGFLGRFRLVVLRAKNNCPTHAGWDPVLLLMECRRMRRRMLDCCATAYSV